MSDSIKPGRYRHFKGGEYQVIDLAMHSETEEPLVVYRPLYGAQGLWVRPLAMFNDCKTLDGRRVPRFELIEPEREPVSQSRMQQQVAAFCAQHGLASDAAARLLDVLSELGELAKLWLKASDYGKDPQGALDAAEWQGEFGDTLFSLLCLANQTGLDVESSLDQALSRYQQRIERAGHPGSDAEAGV